MAGPSRPNPPGAGGGGARRNKTETIALPSGASYPSFLEPLTPNERALLDAYDRIKRYEREAARLKAEEAKRRLEEADERYRAKVRERELAEGRAGAGGSDDDGGDGGGDEKRKPRGDDDDDGGDARSRGEEEEDRDDDRGDDSDEDLDEEAVARRRKRAREIQELRREVEAAKKKEGREEAERKAAKREAEALRRAHLGEDVPAGGGEKEKEEEDDDDSADDAELGAPTPADTGPSIKKKRKVENPWDLDKPKPSLIANMDGGATPVHDFSKKLGMSRISLDGSVLFPPEGSNLPWEPPAHPADFRDGCLELELPDFDASPGSHSGNNTVALKFHAPQDSKRFSVNLAGPDHDGYNDILFHFNPRHFKKGGQLVLNDRKESMWGNDLSVPLSTLPVMFGRKDDGSERACTLVIQINDEGFDVFVDGQHCARLEHRTVLPPGKGSLFLQLPSSDDYGNPEDWRVYRVWWGRKRSMAAANLDGVAGVDLRSSVHPRKLFVSGLAKLHSDPEVDLRRAELERAFRKYGGPSGAVLVSVQKGSTFAFVEVASEAQAELALREMGTRYRVNRARRTRHEALVEERAAKEAAAGGKGREEGGVDWD